MIAHTAERNVARVTAAAEEAILDPFVGERLRTVAKASAPVIERRRPPGDPVTALGQLLRDQPRAKEPFVRAVNGERLADGQDPDGEVTQDARP